MLVILLVLAALILVAASFAVGKLMTEKEERNTGVQKRNIIALLVISFVIFLSSVKPFIEKKYNLYAIMKNTDNNSYYSALKEHDINFYNELKETIHVKIENKTTKSLHNELRGKISSYIYDRLVYCSDVLILKYIDLLIENYERIGAIDKEIGYYLMYPNEDASKNINWSKYYNENDTKLEYDLYSEIVKQSSLKKQYQNNEEIFKVGMEEVGLLLFEKYGDFIGIIEKVPTNKDERELHFSVLSDMYKYIRKLGDERSAKIFRWMFTAENR